MPVTRALEDALIERAVRIETQGRPITHRMVSVAEFDEMLRKDGTRCLIGAAEARCAKSADAPFWGVDRSFVGCP